MGTYKASFSWERYGNQFVVGARLVNDAPHAVHVELGRNRSYGVEVFTTADQGGAIVVAQHGTQGYEGLHILENAALAAVRVTAGGTVRTG